SFRVGKISVSPGFSNVGFSAGFCWVCHPGRALAFSHVGTDGPRRGPYRGVDAACRSGDEVGRVRMPAGGADSISARTGSLVFGSLCTPCLQLVVESFVDRKHSMGPAFVWLWILARRFWSTGGDRYRVRRDGGIGSKGFQIRHRLL